LIRVQEPARPSIASQRTAAKIPLPVKHDIGYAVGDKSGQAPALAEADVYHDNPRLPAPARLWQTQFHMQIEYGQRLAAEACDSSERGAGSRYGHQITEWQNRAHTVCVDGEIPAGHAKRQIALETARG
jgi:hypothetical protein